MIAIVPYKKMIQVFSKPSLEIGITENASWTGHKALPELHLKDRSSLKGTRIAASPENTGRQFMLGRTSSASEKSSARAIPVAFFRVHSRRDRIKQGS